MKLNELVYDVRESLNQTVKDSDFSDEYVAYLINVYRAEILKNELNDFQRLPNIVNIQSFCLEMEQISKYDCNIDIECGTILRSKQPIPSLLKTHIGSSITSIRPTDISAKPFQYITESRLSFINGSKFGNSIYYFIGSDQHVYLVSKSDTHKLIKCINVSGIFANPLELEEYKNCCNCEEDNNQCFDILESDYPISADQVATIITLIAQRLISKLQIPTDNTNDAANDS